MTKAQLRVTPIGTCRIHRPFLAGKDTYPFILSKGRVYGYTHSTREAIQQVKHMLGVESPPAELAPLINGHATYSKQGEAWDGADLIFLEISTKKVIEFQGAYVQINRVEELFSSRPELLKILKRFPSAEQFDQRKEPLASLATFKESSERDKKFLLEAEIHTQTEEDIRQDMLQLRDLLGGPIVVVTHCDVVGRNGAPIQARREVIDMVKNVAQSAGMIVFDPSEVIERVGQEFAMMNDGVDVNHYTLAFEGQLCGELFEQFIAPTLEGQRVSRSA